MVRAQQSPSLQDQILRPAIFCTCRWEYWRRLRQRPAVQFGRHSTCIAENHWYKLTELTNEVTKYVPRWCRLCFFCYSSVRRWWPTSLCFYSWSSQWVAPPRAPPDRVLAVCLNALESPLKVLQVIWDACGGKYERYPLLGRDAAVFHQRLSLKPGSTLFGRICLWSTLENSSVTVKT